MSSLEVSIHRLPEFTSVKLSGPATIEDFVELIAGVAEESRRLGDRRMLVDQLDIPVTLKFTDHFRIGEAVARHLQHLERMATVVPPDKITRTSEKVALRQGMQLRVFTSMTDAIRWLQQ
ncbi:STAS/SEC14 domain-containing protein [Ramlibacter sp.]|uniref:STAS/SEC14 domain-containing protein n=1 Tax=Ramlibacter sp. TaxID=1917967 RepID=UPI002CF8AA14|nr:STAS/SEC14 domain-containing protein [Ramlibacter sp.]HWI83059.1 STAS/SEC14 domain-containing protein [Ramlibacter sp.]